jgi:hypothetical protein
MADFTGAIDGDNFGLTDQTGSGGRILIPGLNPGVPPQWTAEQVGLTSDLIAGGVTLEQGSPQIPNNYTGVLHPYPGDDFFEKMIVVPRSIQAGLVLAVEIFNIDVYNSYRNVKRTFSSFTDNTDSGVQVTNLPGLPVDINRQDGIVLDLEISPIGPAFINGTLDFTFDVGSASILVTGQRSILFPFEPVVPLVETLISKTDIRRKRTGTEQRAALREVPRQRFNLIFELDGFDRQFFDAIIFDKQHVVLGIPVWYEPARLESAIAVDDTVITVDSTAYSDYRADSLAIVWNGADDFEALEISSFTATTITFKTPFTKTFAVGARVMPIRVAFLNQAIRGTKLRKTIQRNQIQVTVLDNDVDLSDTSAFSTFNSKVFVDEPNMVEGGNLSESYERRMTIIDNQTGVFDVFSEQTITPRGHVKQFFCGNRQRLWEVRQLLHALKGRAISFYTPSFFDEMTVLNSIAPAGTVLTIRNIGYNRLIQDRLPKKDLRIVLKDGTESAVLTVQSSTEVSSTTEQITVSPAFGITADPDDIERVEYIEKVRMDSDEVKIKHTNGIGQAVVTVPVVGVPE